MRDLSLTLVVPCYNEETRLDTSAFLEWVSARPWRRLCFVDDASLDQTAAVLDHLRAQHSRIAVLHLDRNHGKAGAVRVGILQDSASDLIGFWDADLATPLEAIGRMHAVLEDDPRIDAVLGSRVQLLGRTIERRPMRHYLGRIFSTFASLALDLAVYDTQCGAKLFRNTPRLLQLFDSPFSSNWIFDVEIIARLKRLHRDSGLSPVEECLFEYPLFAWCDVRGSKLKTKDFFRAALDLYRIWRYLAKP